uniref:RING-type domain-containing protein n=1 Tax=Caenorhabditis japonica TaxID=281687 RepID=A0A8R1HMT2_CAEJA
MSRRSQVTQNNKKCGICQEETTEEDMQELNCSHAFCNLCMTVYQGSLCPIRFCEGTRCTDVIVDEMEGKSGSQIAFGVTSTLFKIDMGEKLKCEAMKKGHKCVNIARMVLIHCRHRLCYDCLLLKVQFALEKKFPPRCAISRCANALSWSEIQAMAAHSNQFEKIYEMALKQPIMFNLPCEKRPTEHEVLIECFLYASENNMKTIVLPKAAIILDAITAVVQLLRISSNLSLSSLDVYVRKDCTEKKGKYKYEVVPTDTRLTIKDSQWADKTTLVIDPEKQISRLRR